MQPTSNREQAAEFKKWLDSSEREFAPIEASCNGQKPTPAIEMDEDTRKFEALMEQVIGTKKTYRRQLSQYLRLKRYILRKVLRKTYIIAVHTTADVLKVTCFMLRVTSL